MPVRVRGALFLRHFQAARTWATAVMARAAAVRSGDMSPAGGNSTLLLYWRSMISSISVVRSSSPTLWRYYTIHYYYMFALRVLGNSGMPTYGRFFSSSVPCRRARFQRHRNHGFCAARSPV